MFYVITISRQHVKDFKMAKIVNNLFSTPITLKSNAESYTISMGGVKKKYSEKREADVLPMDHYGNLVKKFIENELPELFHNHTYSLVRIGDDTFVAVCLDQA